MAALSASKSWLMGGTALGVSLVAWLSGHGGARLLAQQLALPEDASLTTIEVAGGGPPAGEVAALDAQPLGLAEAARAVVHEQSVSVVLEHILRHKAPFAVVVGNKSP